MHTHLEFRLRYHTRNKKTSTGERHSQALCIVCTLTPTSQGGRPSALDFFFFARTAARCSFDMWGKQTLARRDGGDGVTSVLHIDVSSNIYMLYRFLPESLLSCEHLTDAWFEKLQIDLIRRCLACESPANQSLATVGSPM